MPRYGDRYVVVEGYMVCNRNVTEIAEGYAGVLATVASYLHIRYPVEASSRDRYEVRKLIAEAAAEKEQRLVLEESLETNGHWKPLIDLPTWVGSLLTWPKNHDLPRLPEIGLPNGAPPMIVCRHRLPGDVYIPGSLIEIFDPLTEASLVESFVAGGFLNLKWL